MILVYLDETGNTGADLRADTGQPVHWVGALLVHQLQWHSSKFSVEAIYQFARSRGYVAADLELHGSEILQGSKNWRPVKLADRIRILEMSVEAIVQNDLHLVAAGCNKPLLAAQGYSSPYHPHHLATWLCLEKVAKYVRSRSELAVLVADDCSSDHKKFARQALELYRVHGAPFGPTVDMSCLLDTLHFMPSSHSPHIQLCDVAMYVRQRYMGKRDARLEDMCYAVNRRFALSTTVVPY